MRCLDTTSAIACLRRGQIVVLPTDTIYGISALVAERTLSRIVQLKQRSPTQSMILLVDQLARTQTLIDSINTRDTQLIAHSERTSWLLATHNAPVWLQRAGKIALRICPHPTIQAICQALGQAIISTSLNKHGEQAASNSAACHVHPLARHMAGIVVDEVLDRQHDYPKASRIIDARSKTQIR